MDYKKTNAPGTTVTRDMMELCADTGNVYETVAIIARKTTKRQLRVLSNIIMYIPVVRLQNWHVFMQVRHCIWIPRNLVSTSLVLTVLFSSCRCSWNTSHRVQRKMKLRI